MKDHEYFVYIMCSRTGTLYIGITNNIYRRALQHKRREIEGFSSKYHCNRLVYEGQRSRRTPVKLAPPEPPGGTLTIPSPTESQLAASNPMIMRDVHGARINRSAVIKFHF